MVAAVATSVRFEILRAISRRCFKLACLLVLRPFAQPCFQGFFATTASADFSRTLIREISPGKVLKLSARAAKLYLVRLSVTVGFRVP